jgi:hypothetical protein
MHCGIQQISRSFYIDCTPVAFTAVDAASAVEDDVATRDCSGSGFAVSQVGHRDLDG